MKRLSEILDKINTYSFDYYKKEIERIVNERMIDEFGEDSVTTFKIKESTIFVYEYDFYGGTIAFFNSYRDFKKYYTANLLYDLDQNSTDINSLLFKNIWNNFDTYFRELDVTADYSIIRMKDVLEKRSLKEIKDILDYVKLSTDNRPYIDKAEAEDYYNQALQDLTNI